MADRDQSGSGELAIRDRMLAELQARLERLEQALADHANAVALKDAVIRELERKVYEQGQALRDGSIEFAAADRMLTDLRSRAQELDAALAYERSRSAQLEASSRLAAHPQPPASGAELTSPRWRQQIGEAIAAFEARFGREPAVLDWNSGLDLVAAFPSATVFSPPDPAAATLPHVDRSVDVVVCVDAAAAVDEARRVASGMVVTIGRASANGEERQVQDASTIDARLEWIVENVRNP